jgi:putative ABC transport system permease protein
MKFLPYLLKNVARHKLRNLFTMLSIGVSLFLVTLLYAYLDFQEELGKQSADYRRLVVTHVEGLTALMPLAVVDRIRALPGVKAAMPLSWFGGLYQDDKLPFAQFATDPMQCMDVWTEYRLPPEQLLAWQQDRTGCVVGNVIAEKRGWKLGDRIVLKGTIYDCNLELTVRGIYTGPDSGDPEMLWFHYSYFDELLKARRARAAGRIGTVFVKVADEANLADVARRIDERFASSDTPLRAMTEQAFVQSFTEMVGNVQAFIQNTALAVVFALVCVAANAMAMSLRERVREVAVLKAIGFQRRTILGLVLGEAMLIALAGGIIGVGSVKLLTTFVDPGVAGIPGLTRFYVPWNSAFTGLLLAVGVGLASGVIPAVRAANLSVVDGLRRVV